MDDLGEQLHVEDPLLQREADYMLTLTTSIPTSSSSQSVSPVEAFLHWQALYLRYMKVGYTPYCYDT